jgi:hypothetical protein
MDYTLEMTLSEYIARREKDKIMNKIVEELGRTVRDQQRYEEYGPQPMHESAQASQSAQSAPKASKQADQLVSIKNDAGKPRYDLLPVAPIREMAEVLEFGSRKYDSNNWRSANPVPLSRHYAAVQRHLNQWWSGEDTDPESGMRHLAHAATTIMFIMELSKSRPQSDDRFRDCAPYNEVK